MEQNDMLVKVLETLDIRDFTFQNSIIQSELISAIMICVISVAAFVVAINLFFRFNTAYGIINSLE